MFQTFEVVSSPQHGPDRLAKLRKELQREALDGFLVPRADRHQGEYVAACDARLSWLTGFTGSAGFCAALLDSAGVFVDGRYRTQVKSQVDLAHFSPVDWPEVRLGDWLNQALPKGGKIGFDQWLHSHDEIIELKRILKKTGSVLVPVDNLVDRIWADRPAPPKAKIIEQPIEFAGKKSSDKRQRIAKIIREKSASAAILTLPDSICWLLNIRGNDVERNPVVQAFAIIHDDGQVSMFTDPSKASDLAVDPAVWLLDWAEFEAEISALKGPVLIDSATVPFATVACLERQGIPIEFGQDPCILPKARKNPVEINGARAAHLRDALAMVKFLCWLDQQALGGTLTEIDVVKKLEGLRRDTNVLKDISFETICGSGPNGAIIHYRVNNDSNRKISTGEMLLVDSGGQYQDGTTDITRTIAIGDVGDDEKTCFTRVLQGMIAISRARFPKGLTGADLDTLARYPLWLAGQDFDHGTGHGVGSYLSVHEGPQRISRVSKVPLETGMILSNEPGYYREGEFGIRIENLIVVQPAPALKGADQREMLNFETLTYVPIDRRLIMTEMLSKDERDWLNAYHAKTREILADQLEGETRNWLIAACATL